ncbi:hypothetical protein [Nostoc sp.]|uniref:hypothetical protein n=1 Tax=Nostoc sp. TaxID=1180 RepID=UPI002FF981CA
MIAHLVAVQTRSDRLQRKQQKLSLVWKLYQQGFEREDVLKTVNIGRDAFVIAPKFISSLYKYR